MYLLTGTNLAKRLTWTHNQCSRTNNTKSTRTRARIIAEKNERSEKVAPVTEKVAPVTPTKYHPTPAAIAMNITGCNKIICNVISNSL